MSGLEGLGIVANVIAVVDLSLKVISWCSKYAQDVKDSSDSRARLLQAAITLHYESEKIRHLLAGKNGSKLKASQKLAHAMGSSEVQLRELESLLSDKTNCSSLRWPLQKEKAERAIRNIENATKTLLEALQIDTAGIILDIDDRTEAGHRRAVIDQLPYVSDAVWDSHAEEHNATCLENTRQDVLREIKEWTEDTTDHSKTVFWLNGMAGTGKSTISRTIARSLSEAGRLGASFFFKRGELNREKISKFVPTIARQLARNRPALESYIHKVILHDPTVASKAVRVQFERLILEPLSQGSTEIRDQKPITIVVDALDECESDADIYLIINLFSRTRDIKKPRTRVFVTSRPDLPVRLGFNDVQGTYQDLVLHEIPARLIEHDISTFLIHEADLIKRRWDSSIAEEPDRRHGSPDQQLRKFLESSAEDTPSRMKLTYGPVLGQLLGSHSSKRKKETIIHDVKRIVGTIINLAIPLSSSALSKLKRIDQKTIDAKLDFLHSVLSIPSSSHAPIRMFHSSFRDYLMDPDVEGNPFDVDKKESSRDLVGDCFQAMESLKTDVCHLGIPGMLRSTLRPEVIDQCLQPEVQYACVYWIHHQMIAGITPRDVAGILKFLEKHLLHWFEAMILLGKSTVDVKLIDFLDDAIRFADKDTEMINLAPLQIYHSILVFAPTNSVVRKTFVTEIPAYLRCVTGRRADWDPRLRSFENSKPRRRRLGGKRSTVFSPGSDVLYSVSSGEYARAWRCDTGECIEELQTEKGSLMALSPDGKYLAVTTPEHKISLSSDTRAHVLEPTQNTVLGDLAFSRDSALLWACSIKGQVNAWNVTTGDCVKDLKCPWVPKLPESREDYECQFKFSMDHFTALLVPDYFNAHIWFLEYGEEEKSFDIALSEGDHIKHSAFSPDGKVLATLSARNKVMQIWDLQIGQCVWQLEAESVLGTMDFSFSPDSRLLAIAYYSCSIFVWDIRSGKCSAKLDIRDRRFLSGISFSPDMDSLLLISETVDSLRSKIDVCNIEVWSLNAEARVTTMRCHEDDLHYLLFSPDGQTFASVQHDGGAIRLWDWPSLLKEPLEDPEEANSLILSHDASTVVASDEENQLRAWDAATGEMLHEIRAKDQSSRMRSYKLSPDSAFIVTDRWDEAAVWDTRNGHCAWQFSQDYKRSTVHFSPDSYRIAVCIDSCLGSGPSVEIWKRTNVLQEITFNEYGITVVSMAITEDSSTFALGLTSEIQIWNLESMICVQKLRMKSAFNLILSSTEILLAGQIRRSLRIWNWKTGEMLADIKLSENNWKINAFLPDNSGIRSNCGVIPMNLGTISRQYLKPSFRLKNHCMQWKENDLIQLPREFQGCQTAILATDSELTVALGISSQRVTVLKISEDELRRLVPLI
ncbi:vegetative incompatibility protein het-E-1 [Fusarium bulbicola]|nr:vegetative incompatibility protein het-E-1 [Fusarium bulbicola]